ncbi:hypothetical protein JYU34_015538 [Plutella xylostella]|uniref:Uncharacterized protein n=1 Tax=Plutella xylostella TaxID=51655 RepID=A0ABQ7Q7B2_PLUXY|nr:hypothetical protein JYU34_015538 [Plutella xylostella]
MAIVILVSRIHCHITASYFTLNSFRNSPLPWQPSNSIGNDLVKAARGFRYSPPPPRRCRRRIVRKICNCSSAEVQALDSIQL